MHVIRMGNTYIQFLNITLRLFHMLNHLKHYGMQRNMGMNYSQVNMKKFICQITRGTPFIMSCIFFVWGFSFIFGMWVPAIIATIAIFVFMALRSFEIDHGRYISVKEIEETETKLRGAK